MKKIIRLTESDLTRIVRRTIREMVENSETKCKVVVGGSAIFRYPTVDSDVLGYVKENEELEYANGFKMNSDVDLEYVKIKKDNLSGWILADKLKCGSQTHDLYKNYNY